MGATNIFMNSYKQAENKLTYNFLCLVEHMPMRNQFLSFLLNGEYELIDAELTDIETVFGGYESNPDGLMRLKTSNVGTLAVYFENKTWACDLEECQLQNHLRVFCSTPSDVLLVITPRSEDRSIIERMANDKVFFRTWNEVAQKLRELNTMSPSFIVSQFLEFGDLRGEFVRPQVISTRGISASLAMAKQEAQQTYMQMFDRVLDLVDLGKFGMVEGDGAVKNHWGRVGIEFKFRPQHGNYGQWFFFGIYYDSFDHGLKLKKPGVPELAFFFDTSDREHSNLAGNGGLKEAIGRLTARGFEENLTVKVASPWRLLFWRKPLDEVDNLSPEALLETLENILTQICEEKGFVQIML